MITINDETAYREEVRALGMWCQENNLTLNVNKIKEMIVDFRNQQSEQPPIHIDGTVVEKEGSFKVLGRHITHKLKWSTHTDSMVKKAQQLPDKLNFFARFEDNTVPPTRPTTKTCGLSFTAGNVSKTF